MLMERYIAFDIGDKRIGIAVTDPFGSMVLPVETYYRKNLAEDIKYLVYAAEGRSVTTIVCGLPLNVDGTPSVQTEKTLYFIEQLKSATKIPVETHDERYSTQEAHKVLIGEDMSRGKRKKHVDALAATFILEDYMSKKAFLNKPKA
ncbi:MAG: Holliday junction resolvase RuvX [Clostridia bacterium]|nr:Holliday junction resolvase RuvX [Clostridia bacterium]